MYSYQLSVKGVCVRALLMLCKSVNNTCTSLVIYVIFEFNMSVYPYTPAAIQTKCSLLARQYSMRDNLDWLSRCTSVVSGLAAIGSLTGSRQWVPQGADGRVLDPQRRTHQQQHCLPGALHPAPACGSTSFTLMPQRHKQWDFIWTRFSASCMYRTAPMRPSIDGQWAALASLDSCSGALKQ